MNIFEVLGLDNDENIIPETIEENEIDKFINDFSFESEIERKLYSDNTEDLIGQLKEIAVKLKDEKYSLEDSFKMFEGLDKILENVSEEKVIDTLYDKIEKLDINKIENIFNSIENIYGELEEENISQEETNEDLEDSLEAGFFKKIRQKAAEKKLKSQERKIILYAKKYDINIRPYRRVNSESVFILTFWATFFLMSIFLLIRGLWLSNVERQTKFINNMTENYDPEYVVLLLNKNQLNKALSAVDNIFKDAVTGVEKIAKGQAVATSRTAYFKDSDLGAINAHKGNLWTVSKKTLRLHEDSLENHGFVKGDFDKYKKIHADMKNKISKLINGLMNIHPTTKINKKALREITRVVKYSYRVIMFQLYITITAMGKS